MGILLHFLSERGKSLFLPLNSYEISLLLQHLLVVIRSKNKISPDSPYRKLVSLCKCNYESAGTWIAFSNFKVSVQLYNTYQDGDICSKVSTYYHPDGSNAIEHLTQSLPLNKMFWQCLS